MGSTSILDPVNQTGSPIQSDFRKLGTINGPASSSDTPPSSDSGVHSLGEQWENMSSNSIYMESEQNGRPSYGNTTRRRVSDTSVSPNTEEGEDIDYPWTDCLLERDSEDISSIVIQQNDRKVQFNKVTIYVSENSMVHSGTDGRNSDIGALSDFSDDHEETGVEQLSGCRIPGCQCDGRIPFMEWGSEDMTETDDSEYEGSIDRENRLYVESYNYDLSEGMTPMTYKRPLRRNRRRRYEVRRKIEVDVNDSITANSDRVIQAERESPKLEPTVQPRTVANDDIPKLRDKPVDHQRGSQTGSDRNYSSEEESILCDRPVTETATAGDGQDSLYPNDTEYWYNVNLLARQAMTGNDDTLSDDNYPDVVKNIVRTAWMRAWDEHDSLPVEQQTGCETPGCQCNGRVEFMVRGSEDMTETDDSEWEDNADRDNRSYVMSNNYNLSEGMVPRTYTPPLRRNRRRRYAIRKKYETDIEDSICDTSDDDFFTDEEWPISEHMVLPRMAADNVNRTVRNRNNNRGRWSCPGSENNITSDENSNQVYQPVTELADMTETDDSEWEDNADRDNRSYVMSNNYNLSEGMVPRTYTPPLRRNRRRRYAIRKKYETDIEDSICDTSDDDFFTDEEWPISEHMVLLRMAADNVNRTVRNRNNNRGRWSCPGSENNITSDENSNQVDQPVTELATAGAGIESDSFSVEHVKYGEISVTKLIPVRVLDTEEPLIMRVSTITSELSEVDTSAYSETDINDIPVIKECVSPERRRPEQLSAHAYTQLVMSDYRQGVTDYCFGVCERTDSINRSGIGWCWDCLGRLLWGYRVSCLVTIVIKDRSYGIDLYTEKRRVYTSGGRPYEVV